MKCPCDGIIMADTEEWQQPRCYYCATPDGLSDKWRCKGCQCRPYACLCNKPSWTTETLPIIEK